MFHRVPKRRLAFLLAALPLLSAEWPDHINPQGRHLHPKTGLEVVSGELKLPRGFRGRLQPAPGEQGLVLPLLTPAKALEPRPAKPGPGAAPEAAGALESFLVVAQHRGSSRTAQLELLDAQGAKLADLRFDLPSQPGDDAPLKRWTAARSSFLDLWNSEASPWQAGLHRAQAAAYGVSFPRLREARGRLDDSGPSLLALLGGRAAVEETLQLDRGLIGKPGAEAAPSVPLKDLRGIETPPHPWSEMRAGRPAPAGLPLAACVPADRALLYLPKPAAALASLEGGGAAFLQRVSTFTGGGGSDTRVVARIFEDLGLGDGRGRRLIASGAVREAVLFFPDLAFLAGTEATVVADLAKPQEAAFLPQGGPHSYATPGGKAYAARRGDRIFLSTSKAELTLALQLDAAHGQNSLGRSDEFAVILDKLAPTPDTEAFFYLPDGFIRHLLSPRVRILQARQATARAAMESVAAAALLRRLDVPEAPLALADLKTRGYLPPELDLRSLTLLPDGRVRHAAYGSLERLTPLERLPLAAVSAEEAEAYRGFVEGYSKYWSRYFDPIALRLEARADGAMALETFVLPLLESSLYQPVRAFLATEGALPRPQWRQPMVAELSLRLATEGMAGRRTPRLLGELPGLKGLLEAHATGVVVAGFPDGAPIIATGNGSPATILQADPFRSRESMVGLGALALGAFTRPLAVAFELKDPEAVRRNLQEELLRSLPMESKVSRELDIVPSLEPNGGLHVRVGLMGLASMRFSLRVEDRWLVFTNDASLPPGLVTGTVPGEPFAARLSLHPEALRLGLSAAFQASVEGEARSAFAAMAWLAPWLMGGRDVAGARAESERLLGLSPTLDAQALQAPRWWEHRAFGTPLRPKMPTLDATKDFGLFEGVREPEVEMRLEDTGLRARVSWRR